MKKLTLCTMTALLLLAAAPMQANAAVKSDPIATTSNPPAKSEESEALLARLNEINTMDKSNLTSSEKRTLRKETRSIKKALAINNGGVYLSVGAIVIIILLLILLL